MVLQTFNARTWEKEEYYHYNFEVSLGYIARLCCLKTNQTKTKQHNNKNQSIVQKLNHARDVCVYVCDL